MTIRKAIGDDYPAIFQLIERAFQHEAFSDHQEHFLVERLLASQQFIEELSIVATLHDKLVGYILLTPVYIKSAEKLIPSLALAPVVVHPDYQKQGIGSDLIRYAHQQATSLGFGSVMVLGHAEYYPRLGYEKASDFHIKFPFEVPHDNCMAIQLIPGALRDLEGVVQYPKEFFNN